VVVAVGLTFVEPLADVEVKVPGAIARLVAPVDTQLSVLLEPEVIPVGLAVKELIVGLLGAEVPPLTVTVSVDVLEPPASVAVSV